MNILTSGIILNTEKYDAEIIKYDWGDTIDFHDPDGNQIGLRDEAGYIEQVKNGEGSA